MQKTKSILYALLYLGAGIGIGILSLFNRQEKSTKLDRQDLPFVLGMIVLDIAPQSS